MVSSLDSVMFFVDSGATHHLVNSLCYFKEVQVMTELIKIYVAKDDECLYATNVGTM